MIRNEPSGQARLGYDMLPFLLLLFLWNEIVMEKLIGRTHKTRQKDGPFLFDILYLGCVTWMLSFLQLMRYFLLIGLLEAIFNLANLTNQQTKAMFRSFLLRHFGWPQSILHASPLQSQTDWVLQIHQFMLSIKSKEVHYFREMFDSGQATWANYFIFIYFVFLPNLGLTLFLAYYNLFAKVNLILWVSSARPSGIYVQDQPQKQPQ